MERNLITLGTYPYKNRLEFSENFQKFLAQNNCYFLESVMEISVMIWNVKWNGIFCHYLDLCSKN